MIGDEDMLIKTPIIQEYININNPAAFVSFTEVLFKFLHNGLMSGYKSIIFVCIGTDRSTGDCLGPLVGYKIDNINYKNVYTFGSLDSPVHAKNLDEIMKHIDSNFDKPFVVAIDACLGKMEHVGYLNIGSGPIKPGAGVKKELLPVGDMFITGIVNFGGMMEFLVLQNTRLSIVMKIADIIASGIRYVIWKLENTPGVGEYITALQ